MCGEARSKGGLQPWVLALDVRPHAGGSAEEDDCPARSTIAATDHEFAVDTWPVAHEVAHRLELGTTNDTTRSFGMSVLNIRTTPRSLAAHASHKKRSIPVPNRLVPL